MSYISSERKKMLFESWLNEEPDSAIASRSVVLNMKLSNEETLKKLNQR
jgi:hypothetical protein